MQEYKRIGIIMPGKLEFSFNSNRLDAFFSIKRL